MNRRAVYLGHTWFIALAASSGKRNITVWHQSFRPSVCLSVVLVTHQGVG